MKDNFISFPSSELEHIFCNPFRSPGERERAKRFLIQRGKGVPDNYDLQPPFLESQDMSELSKMCSVLLQREKRYGVRYPLLHYREISQMTFSDVQHIIYLYEKRIAK